MAGPYRYAKGARQQRIVDTLTAVPSLRLNELVETLGVSGETIRRDLRELDERGLISRTYGGAVRTFVAEPALAERRRLMTAPSRPHSPRFSSTAVLNRGMAGQKTRLPSITSIAGNSVSMATSAHRMPAAPIGPSPLVLFRSATSRHSRPATTVAADAMMAGAAPRSA